MRAIQKGLILAGCMLLLPVGCFSDDSQSGWDIGTRAVDSGSDAAADPDTDDSPNDAAEDADAGEDAGDGGEPDGGTQNYEITFELENRSGQPVHAYRHVAPREICTSQDYYWLTIEGSSGPVRPFDDCAFCECGEQSCGICDIACPEPPNEQNTLLAADETRSFVWDARHWAVNHDEMCEESVLLEGESLEATMCWGSGVDEQVAQLTDERCVTVDVDITPDRPRQVVRVVIPDEEPSPEVTFRMSNASDRDLYAEPLGATEGGDFSPPCEDFWYTVGDGTETFSLRTTCGQCTCDSLRNSGSCDGACPGVVCPSPSAEDFSLAPGEERMDPWDGKIAVQGEVDGTDCIEMVDPPTDDLEATICHAQTLVSDTGEPPGPPSLGTTTCSTVEFNRMTADEVVLRIE